MKKLFVLGASALLLCSCGGTTIDSSLDETAGQEKLDSINENMETALGNKCVTIEAPVEVEPISVESSGFSSSVTYTGSITQQFDTVDEVAYVHEVASIKISGGNEALTINMNMDTDVEAWVFDGQMATKSYMSSNLLGTEQTETDYSIDDFGDSIKDVALDSLLEVGDYATNANWGTINYYGSSNEGDLRIVASNGMIGTFPVESFEITYEGGLPRKATIKQSGGIELSDAEMMFTTTYTINYPDSLNITTPDLTSEEWANAQ